MSCYLVYGLDNPVSYNGTYLRALMTVKQRSRYAGLVSEYFGDEQLPFCLTSLSVGGSIVDAIPFTGIPAL